MANIRGLKRYIGKASRQPLYAARVFAKRAVAYLSYVRGDGRSALPESITLFLTHRCNLRCRMCGQWGASGVNRRPDAGYVKSEMSPDGLKRAIDAVAFFRPNITLFGGEPLLYKDCGGIIRYIKESGMHCLIITNGSALEESAKSLVDSGLDEINISIDGAGELHDSIRGMPGLFDKIMAGMKKVSQLKKESGRKRPLINIQCTITRYNYGKLEGLIDVADEARADSLTFHNLIFLDRGAIERQKPVDRALGISSRGWEGFEFESGIDPEKLYEKICGLTGAGRRYPINIYPPFSKSAMKEYYGVLQRTPAPGRCLSPWIAAYIFPDGEVRPCLNLDCSFGNISGGSFGEIWNSPAAVGFRRFLKKERAFPACVRCTELYRY